MPKLPKQYDPAKHEPKIYQKWEQSNAFKPNQGQPFDRQQKKPFVIMLPLPNITGSLHMGHALQHTIMDILIRYHRMKGDPTLWQPGTDHAGIATQNVVEKSLREQGISRHDLGRAKFLKKVWEWREKYGNTIVQQMKRLGSSCDWSRSVFTMDDNYMTAVQEAFIRYYEKGYIYRGNRIVNWCPRCASVISDLEINHVAKDSELYTLSYPLVDRSGHIKVATTRPETILGDTAVAVNPSDDRYKEMVGQQVTLPLTDRQIPIIADKRVDVGFGTGAVKVTPAHDPLDAQIGETHKLPVINVIGEDGKMTEQAGAFHNQPIAEARQNVIAALDQQSALVSAEPYRHTLTLCDRCDTPIEPLISRQWFVDMSKLKDETINVAEEEMIKFLPPRWKKNFLDWMNNVHDWTISRQLWWGHQIPVWWKQGTHGTEQEEGNYAVSIDKPGDDWEQDPDVLDTWFSSALWPFATLGWPDSTTDLKTFYPTTVLITAREILYLWVARMIFSGLDLLQDEKYEKPDRASRIPFEHVFIYPTVLAKDGRRMSKSLGTGVNPLESIDEYGADATRFGLMFQMSYDNQAIKFDEASIKSARNFANKIWNIARFLESMPEQDDPQITDQWIEQRAQAVHRKVSELLEQYKIGEAARLLYDFIWNDFADWYIEIIKVKGSSTIAKQTFRQILLMLHPFMPHLTESLWEHIDESDMLITTSWQLNDTSFDKSIDKTMHRFQDIVTTIRSIRTLLQISPGVTVDTFISDNNPMPEVVAKLVRANVVNQVTAVMKQFPLSTGGTVSLGSSVITNEVISSAVHKLSKEEKDLKQFIERQSATLSAMEGKAPLTAIAEKKDLVKQAKTQLAELQASLAALDS